MEMNNNKIIKVVIDAMGGDFSPNNEIEGMIHLFKKFTIFRDNVEVILVGKETKLNAIISQYETKSCNYSIVNAEDVVNMSDDPSTAYRRKETSLYKGLDLVKNGFADAFVSAGNTGAVMATSTLMLGRIKGVSRPTIGSFFPTTQNRPTLLIDVGANVDCKAKFIYEFAVMGSIHYKNMLGIDNPKVALLNIGEESTKGNQTVLEAYNLLSESKLNFIGNVEGRDILKGKADVVICDGFTGNVILKFAESFLSILKVKIKKFAEKNLFNSALAGILKPVFKSILKDFDYQEYGGVPLLGVNGTVIIGHGKSTPKAVMHMIKTAIEMVQNDVNKKIEFALNNWEV